MGIYYNSYTESHSVNPIPIVFSYWLNFDRKDIYVISSVHNVKRHCIRSKIYISNKLSLVVKSVRRNWNTIFVEYCDIDENVFKSIFRAMGFTNALSTENLFNKSLEIYPNLFLYTFPKEVIYSEKHIPLEDLKVNCELKEEKIFNVKQISGSYKNSYLHYGYLAKIFNNFYLAYALEGYKNLPVFFEAFPERNIINISTSSSSKDWHYKENLVYRFTSFRYKNLKERESIFIMNKKEV